MAHKATAVLSALQAAAKGLLFPSEQDKPVKAFTWTSEETKGAATPADAVANAKGVDKATLKMLTLAAFFAPTTTLQDWYGDDEKATAAKFTALVKTLTDTLKEPVAIRVEGGTTIDVYVLGLDADGNWSGVSTQLIET